jgi:adenine-specific DNA-methyltransferase
MSDEKIQELEQEIKQLKAKLKKRYGLVWEDKKEEFDKDSKNALPILKDKNNPKYPNINTGVKNGKAPHILIEGDNYHTLSVLNYTHKGKIDVIYIDPPYNTGNNDFIYNDKFVDKEDSFRHSKWLSFMSKRLKLAKDLLTDDGVIFISIDDNEQAQLKLLCDEIFGENNLTALLKIQVRYDNKSLNEKKDFQEIQEYVFLYSNNAHLSKFNKPKETYSLQKFNLDIKHSETPTKTITKNNRVVDVWEKNDFSIQKVDNPSELYFKETWISGSIYSNTGHGTMYKKMIEDRVKEDGYSCLYRIHGIGEDGLGYRYYTNPKEKKYTKGKMYTKIPLDKLEQIKNGDEVEKENPIIAYNDFSADFGNIRHEGGVAFNSGKKPIKMLKQFIKYINGNKNAIVLDFFAGSGTTGHAVLELNKQDGGNRQFILATNNENGICENITYERIKRVMQGYTTPKGKEVEGLGGELQYLKTDFIKKDNNLDDLRLSIVNASTTILCCKESIFNIVIDNYQHNKFKIFKDDNKYLCILFGEFLPNLQAFYDEFKKFKHNKVIIYAFISDVGYLSTELKNIDSDIDFHIKEIPDELLATYNEIFGL